MEQSATPNRAFYRLIVVLIVLSLLTLSCNFVTQRFSGANNGDDSGFVTLEARETEEAFFIETETPEPTEADEPTEELERTEEPEPTEELEQSEAVEPTEDLEPTEEEEGLEETPAFSFGQGEFSEANLPAEVPPYPDARIQTVSDGLVVFESDASLDEIGDFYEEALTGEGWDLSPFSVTEADMFTQIWSKGEAILTVSSVLESGMTYTSILCVNCTSQ